MPFNRHRRFDWTQIMLDESKLGIVQSKFCL